MSDKAMATILEFLIDPCIEGKQFFLTVALTVQTKTPLLL